MTAPAHGVLLIAYWYPPLNESGALRPSRFAKYLRKHGIESNIICGPVESKARLPANVHATPGASAPRPGRIASAAARLAQRAAPYSDELQWVPFAYEAGACLLRSGQFRTIFSTSPPLATHLSALLLRRRFDVRWIADFRDPIIGNPFRSRSHGRHYDRLVERLIVTRADAVIVNTDTALDEFRARYPERATKFHLIWNGYDPDELLLAGQFAPRDVGATLSHFGALYGGRHPGIVLDALARLVRAGHPSARSVRIRLVGSIDPQHSWTTGESAEFLRSNQQLDWTHSTIPRAEAQEQMCRSDYLLLLDMNERATSVQVPAKLFEYVRVGRPILAVTGKASPVERILSGSGVPHVCIYIDDTQSRIDQKLLEFFALPPKPVLPSEWFIEQFDASIQCRSLARIIRCMAAAEDGE